MTRTAKAIVPTKSSDPDPFLDSLSHDPVSTTYSWGSKVVSQSATRNPEISGRISVRLRFLGT
jgi:hypothetical protein